MALLSPAQLLPTYRSLRQYFALKVRAVVPTAGEGAVLLPENADHPAVTVSQDFYDRWSPLPGGYYVIDEGSLEAFYTDADFEHSFQRIG